MTNKEITKKLIAVINNDGTKDTGEMSYIAGFATVGGETAAKAHGDVRTLMSVLAGEEDTFLAMMEACLGSALSDGRRLAMFCEAVRQANEWVGRQKNS